MSKRQARTRGNLEPTVNKKTIQRIRKLSRGHSLRIYHDHDCGSGGRMSVRLLGMRGNRRWAGEIWALLRGSRRW